MTVKTYAAIFISLFLFGELTVSQGSAQNAQDDYAHLLKTHIVRYTDVGNLLDFKAFFGPWRSKLTMIEEKKRSQEDIEHKIIRPTIKDARAHYTLNGASLGCPNQKKRPGEPKRWRLRLWSSSTIRAERRPSLRAVIPYRVFLNGTVKISAAQKQRSMNICGNMQNRSWPSS